MKWVLFFFCCTGLVYCILMIVYNLASMLWMYKEFRFLSTSFNYQYKALRSYIEKEMTDQQIYLKVKDDPDTRDLIFFNGNLFILFTQNAGVTCENTAKTREYLIKAGSLIQKLKEAFEECNIIFAEGIYDENEVLFKELQDICEKKGEPTFFEDVKIEKYDSDDYYNNTDDDKIDDE